MMWLNGYEIRARLAPGLLALFPIAIACATLGLRRYPAVACLISALSLAGGPLLLAEYVRSVGLRAQVRLWHEWGGAPTTAMLRLRDAAESAGKLERRRQAVQAATGITLATAQEEANDPAAADDLIEESVEKLRGLTRADSFKLLLIENGWYGFQRNLYGLRWVGRGIALICCAGLAVVAAWVHHQHGASVDVNSVLVGIVISGLWLLIWLFLPSAKRAKLAAEKYAGQLMESVTTIPPPPS